MKRFIALCVIIIGSAAELSFAGKAGDYLMPLNDDDGIAGTYRKLYESKLFVTPGDIARYVSLPGLKGEGETSASIHQTIKKGGMPGNYWVTTLKSSGSLWDTLPQPGSKPSSLRAIRIQRCDAPIPESTARSIHKAWVAMLQRTRSAPLNEVRGDSSNQIFAVRQARNRLLRAETHDFGKNNMMLIELGEGLIGYCDTQPSKRMATAILIEKHALALLKRSDASPTD